MADVVKQLIPEVAMVELLQTVLVGIGATAVMDIWGAVRQPLFGFPRLDYAMLGRWFGHMAAGRFRHQSIRAASPVRGEVVIGWAMHYLIGSSFALLLVGLWGTAWLDRPTLGPALVVGIATVVAPLFIMQPAMGAGIASARMARPGSARIQSLLSHAIYGLGLYLAGLIGRLVVAS